MHHQENALTPSALVLSSIKLGEQHLPCTVVLEPENVSGGSPAVKCLNVSIEVNEKPLS